MKGEIMTTIKLKLLELYRHISCAYGAARMLEKPYEESRSGIEYSIQRGLCGPLSFAEDLIYRLLQEVQNEEDNAD